MFINPLTTFVKVLDKKLYNGPVGISLGKRFISASIFAERHETFICGCIFYNLLDAPQRIIHVI